MANYEQKNNELVVFPNDRKTEDRHPDFKGTGMIDGVLKWVSMWENTSKKDGTVYFKIVVQDKVDNAQQGTPRQAPRQAPAGRPAARQQPHDQRNESPFDNGY